MNIALISPHGMSTIIFCKTMSRILSDRGHVVHTISPTNGYDKEIQKIKSIHHDIPMKRGVSVFRDFHYIYKIRKILIDNKISEVISFTTKPNAYAWLYTMQSCVLKTHIAVRGLGRVYSGSGSYGSRISQFGLNFLYGASIKRAKTVWFTNTFDQARLNSLFEIKCDQFVTKNAISLSHYAATDEVKKNAALVSQQYNINGKKVVLMVARLLKSKGVYEFLDCAIHLLEKKEDILFILVAPVEIKSYDSIDQLEVENKIKPYKNIIWIDFMKDLRPLYYNCDVAVLPSFYQEGGYPRALLEPMAFSKPVIAANTNECRGPVKDGYNGFLVEPRDYKMLADRVIDILSCDSSNRMGKNSKMIVDEHHDDSTVVVNVLSNMRLL